MRILFHATNGTIVNKTRCLLLLYTSHVDTQLKFISQGANETVNDHTRIMRTTGPWVRQAQSHHLRGRFAMLGKRHVAASCKRSVLFQHEKTAKKPPGDHQETTATPGDQ